MKRIKILAVALALSNPFIVRAEEPKKTERPTVLIERRAQEATSAPNPGSGAASQPGAPQSRSPQVFGTNNVWGGGKSAAQWYIQHTDAVTKLSEEQKKKITSIIEARDKEVQAFQTTSADKAKSISAGMTEAYKGKDQEAIAKAQKAYQDLYAPMNEIMKKSNVALQDVLTAEQKSKLQDHRITSTLTAYAPGVAFTDAQLKQLKEAAGRVAGDHEGFERKLPSLIDEVLTDEQSASVFRSRVATYIKMVYGNAKLTDEQLKKFEAKATEMAKGKKRSVQVDAAAYQALSEFAGGLLTSEQKELLKAPRLGFVGAGGGLAVASGATPANPGAGKPMERKNVPPQLQPQGVKVEQLPGGGIQVFISESGNPGAAKGEQPSRERIELMQRQMQEMAKQTQASHRDGMRERVRRQRELTKQASKLMKKLDEVGRGDSPKARELWEQLERVQAQLQQTFGGPAGFSFGAAANGAWVVQSSTSGAQQPLAINTATLQPMNPTTVRTGTLQVKSPVNVAPSNVAPVNIAPANAQSEVFKAIDTLRRQVEELRAQVIKLSEKK